MQGQCTQPRGACRILCDELTAVHTGHPSIGSTTCICYGVHTWVAWSSSMWESRTGVSTASCAGSAQAESTEVHKPGGKSNTSTSSSRWPTVYEHYIGENLSLERRGGRGLPLRSDYVPAITGSALFTGTVILRRHMLQGMLRGNEVHGVLPQAKPQHPKTFWQVTVSCHTSHS